MSSKYNFTTLCNTCSVTHYLFNQQSVPEHVLSPPRPSSSHLQRWSMSASPPRTVYNENSNTRVPNRDEVGEPHLPQLHSASAINDENLDDKIPDYLQQSEDEWQDDPVNPRNWSPARKWTATTVVSSFIRIGYLTTRPNFGSACTLHVCDSISKFYHGTRIARCGHKIWYNRSNSHSVDSQHLRSVTGHRSFICRTLV